MTESQVQHAIMAELGALPWIRIWRANTGAAKLSENGRHVRFGTPGQADIIGIVAPHGRMIGIEVKSQAGKATRRQVAWGNMIEAMGGVYAVCRSVQEARAACERAREDR
jgi:hypothetical protein